LLIHRCFAIFRLFTAADDRRRTNRSSQHQPAAEGRRGRLRRNCGLTISGASRPLGQGTFASPPLSYGGRNQRGMVMDEKYECSFSLASFPHGVSLISIGASDAQLKVAPCAIILTRYPLHLLPITAHQIAMLGALSAARMNLLPDLSIGACPYGAARTSLALPDLSIGVCPYHAARTSLVYRPCWQTVSHHRLG
jgi:hypothetical protein